MGAHLNNIEGDVVHGGTIQRAVYVSNGRPLEYQDPADQIRAKVRSPFNSSFPDKRVLAGMEVI